MVQKYPSLQDLLDYNTQLSDDNWNDISLINSDNCAFLVFDENRSLIYMTPGDESLKAQITADDLWLINSANDSDYYYRVYELEETGSRSILRLYNKKSQVIIKNQCIIDANNNIVSGSLFTNKKSLSDHDMQLILGTLESGKDAFNISKYSYYTNEGKDRTLVFVSKIFEQTEYNQTMEKLIGFWPIMLVIGSIVIVFQAFMFDRRIKKEVDPIGDVIKSYANGEIVEINEQKTSVEFQVLLYNFKDLVTQLEVSRKEKERADNEKRRIIANLSHDLKTPLTVIQGYSGAFLDGKVPEDKRVEYMETIFNKSVYSAELIDTLSVYTSMDYPEYIAHKEVIDFNEFAREYLANKYSEIDFHHFDLEVEIGEEPLMAEVDAHIMSRCLDNLIDNSLKYNEDATTLYFSVYDEDDIRIVIADDGIGIDPSVASHIFEPFVTENDARTSGKGTGLGMTISKSVITLHGGTINVVYPPKLGKGAEFEIHLPKLNKA